MAKTAQHSPAWGGAREGAGAPSTGRTPRCMRATDDEWLKIMAYADSLRYGVVGKSDIELAAGPAAELGAMPVYFGGPVQTDRGFVLHRPLGHWQSTLEVKDEIGLTSSRDILEEMGSTGAPADVLVSLGYAGWSAGQLEWELAQNAWLTVAADPRILFGMPPEERLAAAMQLLGVDFANLSDVAGHA